MPTAASSRNTGGGGDDGLSSSSSSIQSPGGGTAPSWRCQFNKSSSFTVDDGHASSEVSFGILHLFRDGAGSVPASSSSKASVALDDDSATVLALLGLPGQMTAADFLAWVEPAISSVEKMRMIRQGHPTNRTAVLIKFRDPSDAEEFYKLYNGQPLPFTANSSSSAPSATTGQASTAAGPSASTSLASLTPSSSMPTLTSAQIVYVTQVTVSTSPHLPYVYPQLANSDPWPLAPTKSTVDSATPSMMEDKTDDASSSTVTPATRLALSLANELPTCPVCLERMDSAVTGIMTVSCQHSFHCECLSRWADGRCPVCRYSQNRAAKGQAAASLLMRAGAQAGRARRSEEREPSSDLSLVADECPRGTQEDEPSADDDEDDSAATCCASCGATDDLWVCLICAAVGCGRYKAGCAARHFTQSNHLYSLELETARVWDYVHDGYVHRLIQNRADGKLVELDGAAGQGGGAEGSPARRRRGRRSSRRHAEQEEAQSAAAGSSRRAGETGRDQPDETSSVYDEDEYDEDEDDDDDDKAKDKQHGGKLGTRSSQLEAISLEYQYLLLSQLESQRSYYEEQVRNVQSRLDSALANGGSGSAKEEQEKALLAVEAERASWQAEMDAVSARTKQLEGKVQKHVTDLVKARKDLEAERLVTRGLLAKLQAANEREERANLEAERAKAEQRELNEELRDLRFALSAQDMIQGEGGADHQHEAQGGDLVVVPGKEGNSGAAKKKKKKKKVPKKPPGVGEGAASSTAGQEEAAAAPSAMTDVTVDPDEEEEE
ncbi:hypothetical protein BDZ90DRAFT_258532 [Jaminaea rosea]|uniref:Zf-UBP-domain-containing protein n=1 Tax=Jaminaea rosea TaxID=1569628 RepID=A0A316UWF6_9BASI|nr:hypothetical protein BDZ90DRAFT_258532 [Jaminaea rosea]PWN29619.1 hypothetical protein BDZ90DRAFT_258532 [Jaminaea rosea]